ncbi:putative tRNA-dihydrouridine synthase [bioreactor metagenome]|uniref:Putative tRNA-dihydrouridine synthase n=1 Tax=bioreactor metagenome TaxID=1076179 RepID=A0A645CHH0_9ZZZZ|nr:tRNA dihydrouridine synthase DusB [Erysipelotrichaceae bacterium]
MLKIGNVELKNNIIVGPMAGITNQAFRSLVLQLGAGLVYSEMLSDKAINYHNQKTLEMLYIAQDEHPITLQLFGNEIDSMVQAAVYLDQNTACDIIDINMGCPVPKVANNGSGSALMRDPDHVYKLVKALVLAVGKPVTVKIRSGLNQQSINAVEIARLCEAAGAAAIAVHPRTKTQMYNGKADWQITKEVKQAVQIPVIGNGDIYHKEDAVRMFAETGCDAIMLARGVLGNPWLIRELLDQETAAISLDDKLNMVLEHTKRLIRLKGEKVAVREMRGQCGWYLNGLPYNNKTKLALSKAESAKQLYELIEEYRQMLHNLG